MGGTSQPSSDAGRERDEHFLREALDLAGRIERRPWPNPPVGALVVRDGAVVGRGAHHGAGLAHAERLALAEAGDRAHGATLYCTLEPCRHQGRTPPCTEAIIAAGIARVVAAIRDLNPAAAGGAEVLRRAGVEVALGTLAGPCLELIWPFAATDGFARPYVELKTATSLDGRFAAADDPVGRPSYLTGEAARRRVHERRRWFDLVLVGAGTARRDRPRLDARLAAAEACCPRAEPAAGCVLGRSADAAGVALDRPAWLCFHPRGAAPRLADGAEPIAVPAGPLGVDPAGLVAVCRERGLQAIYLEGGPRLAATFLGAGLVDRWVQHTAPRYLGDGPTWPQGGIRPAAGGFHLTRHERLEGDLCAVWDRRDFGALVAEASGSKGRP